MLSAKEVELATEGRARDQRCASCQIGSLQSLSISFRQGLWREVHTDLLQQVQSLHSPHSQRTLLRRPSMGQITVWGLLAHSTGPRISTARCNQHGRAEICSLRNGQKHLRRAARVPAEVCRQAPEETNQTLMEVVNNLLEGRHMPEYWRGGDIRFILKKSPANLLPVQNWRPITLVQVTFKIASIILTKRLQRVAEHYQVLEPTQEGFRQGRSTTEEADRKAETYPPGAKGPRQPGLCHLH